MKKRLLKFAAWTAATIATLAVVFVLVVLIRSNRKFDAPYPAVRASSDPAVIERGRYIVYGPGHCVGCHTSPAESDEVRAGAMPPLAGGYEFVLPLGRIRAPNLTPDPETGIGRRSDEELARVLRHGVMPDGRAAIPFMEAQNLSHDDLVAVISFLRSQPPVRRAVPSHEINLIGKAVTAFLIKPVGPSGPVLQSAPSEAPTVERGAYLATSVAACAACHTKRNMLDGSFENERFAGGSVFEIEGDPEHILVTPNLTPSKVGRIAGWTEEQFVGRFGAGTGMKQSHMPWRQYQRMSVTDLRALYRYLRTLPPSEFDPGPVMQKKKA